MKYVYVILNRENSKAYVGQSKIPIKRKAQHLNAARRGSDSLLCRAIRKYCGEEVDVNLFNERFEFRIIDSCEDDLIDEREQFWVTKFDSFNPEKGYNLTSGGLQSHLLSEESRKKIGDYWRGRKQDPEHIRKRIETFLKTGCRKGIQAWNKGIPMTEEMKKKICGPKSDDVKQKISQTLKGRSSSCKGKKFGPGKCSLCSELGHKKNKCPQRIEQ